jgi:hypothetical protein
VEITMPFGTDTHPWPTWDPAGQEFSVVAADKDETFDLGGTIDQIEVTATEGSVWVAVGNSAGAEPRELVEDGQTRRWALPPRTYLATIFPRCSPRKLYLRAADKSKTPLALVVQHSSGKNRPDSSVRLWPKLSSRSEVASGKDSIVDIEGTADEICVKTTNADVWVAVDNNADGEHLRQQVKTDGWEKWSLV